ncbi:hypothetical protein [Erwinia mallotivora]|uniref:Uncharacterized protein n=1 Tax=Erwinia mallotivora TaxID=69222 RepID=A0A014MFB2_9GAMM|nr:hypothetical protein [Erwinia mallotivora]EXU76769.1 hypothetical protein BG55_03820 [Erwinia mallotivora]
MSWEIVCSSESIDYVLIKTQEEESFTTESIIFNDRKIHQEPSGGYQEPNDHVMTDTYIANSEHGSFTWVVTARRSGFNSFAEIEDIQSFEPIGCEALEIPLFSIRQN